MSLVECRLLIGRVTIAALGLLVPSVIGGAQTAEQVQHVGQFYKSQDGFSGNVVVFHDGHILSDESYGLANVEWQIPIGAKTRFAIGSVTKQFTAAGILLLQEQGRLKTSDPVSKYYADSPPAWKDITVRELLLHTSGIPDDIFASGSVGFEQGHHTPQEVVRAVTDKPLLFPPGTHTAYNNVEYVLLGLVIEKASGETYAGFLEKHIFAPFGMHDTGIGWAPEIIPDRAYGYSRSSLGTEMADQFYASGVFSAGAMYSTGTDLATWLIALHGGRVLRPASYTEMTSPDADGYGYGLTVSTQYGRQDLGHGGDVPGFHVSTEYFPAKKTGIVVLTNVTNGRSSPGTYAIANDLMALASDEQAIVRSTGRERTIDPAVLHQYAGSYTAEEGSQTQRINIELRNKHLVLAPQQAGKEPSTLQAESATRFYAKEWDGEIEFSKDEHGATTMLIFAYTNETATQWRKLP